MQLKKHLVTASYVDDAMSKLNEKAKSAGITILGEMGLDPGIGNGLGFIKMENSFQNTFSPLDISGGMISQCISLILSYFRSYDGNEDDQPSTCS